MVVASIAAKVPSFDVVGDDISDDMFTDCVRCACAQDASNSLLTDTGSTLVASFAVSSSVV